MTHSGFAPHNHESCISDTLAAAEAYCARENLKFTKVRRRVLELLLTEHKALGAYELLHLLGKEGLGSQPPVAYRALDFLSRIGFVHKIEKLNAFVACTHPGGKHTPAFMICRNCNAVAEATELTDTSTLNAAAQAAGFVIENAVVEAQGLCPSCQSLP